MFGFLKKESKSELEASLSKKLVAHLNGVDNLYMDSYGIKTSRKLYEYLSPDAIQIVNKNIFQYGTRYFGTPKFRKTKWVPVNLEHGVLTVLKEVTFDKIRVGSSCRIAIADNYKEQWQIDINKVKEPLIINIKGVPV